MTRTAVVLLLLVGWAPTSAAPVPPRPKTLTEEQLVGRWDFSWGESRGALWMDANGEYTETLSGHGGAIYYGRWWLERNTLVMCEYRFDPESQSQWGPQTFHIDLDVREWPWVVTGTTGLTRIEMSHRR